MLFAHFKVLHGLWFWVGLKFKVELPLRGWGGWVGWKVSLACSSVIDIWNVGFQVQDFKKSRYYHLLKWLYFLLTSDTSVDKFSPLRGLSRCTASSILSQFNLIYHYTYKKLEWIDLHFSRDVWYYFFSGWLQVFTLDYSPIVSIGVLTRLVFQLEVF